MKPHKFILTLLLAFSLVECSNLEENAISQLEPDERSVNLETVETTIAGAFGHLDARAFLSRHLGLTLMLRSDMVDIGNPSTNAERVEMDQFTVSANNPDILNISNPDRSFWPRLYQMVRGANETIRELDVLEPQDAGVTEEIEARARFLRAFAYYHLVRLFGDVPFLDELTTTADASIAPRMPVDEIYANIIADLEFAKEWLLDTRSNRAIPGKSAASAYLASVYLTRGNYQMALNEATEIINNAGLYNLALEPDYRNIFHSENTDASIEPIFIIDFVGTNINDESRDYLAAFTGFFGQATYYPSGGWSVAVPAQAVYDTWDSGRDSHSNYQLMRYAEVLLIAAEAAAELGNTSQAAQFVNMVRERARNGNGLGTPSAVPADISTATVNDVLEERRLELAFEHKRWYDIVRRRMGDQVFGPNGFETELLGTQNFDPARDYLLPIPPFEIENNPNLTQNPGY